MAEIHSIEIKEFDTIIVGSGLAGLTAAFHASKKGSVAIITKSQLDIIATKLNTRPRKTLAFKTPADTLNAALR